MTILPSGELLRLVQFREHAVRYCRYWHGLLLVMSMVGRRNIRNLPFCCLFSVFVFLFLLAHLWSRYVQMLRCALLREKELVIEPMVQTRWCNRAAVHLFCSL